MGTALPHGYVSFRDATKVLAHVLYAGVPDRPKLASLRAELGMRISDGQARETAKREIWKSVDQGKLRLVAAGGMPRRLIRLDAEITKEVPALRKTCGFHYLRPTHRLHSQFVGWFGRDLHQVTLAFRKTDVDGLSKRLLRSRRGKVQRNSAGNKGRSSRRSEVEVVIRAIIDARQWAAPTSIKTLTHLVNKQLSKPVSEDSVTRALDQMEENFGDRKYTRLRRRPRS